MKKSILFDLDGTLVNSIPTLLTCFRQVFAEFEAPYPGDERISALIGTGAEEILSAFFPNKKVDTAIANYRKFYLRLQQNGVIVFYPKVRDVLISLRSDEYTLGIITSKPRFLSEQLLGQLEAMEYFSVIVGGEDVTNKKPHPEPLYLALKNLGIPAEQSIYVGDSIHDAQSAKNAGMRFVGVLTGTASRETLSPYGTVFDSLADAHNSQAFRII